MGESEAQIRRSVEASWGSKLKAQGLAAPSAAMSMTGRWLVRLAIDAQRASDTIMPTHADSPVILHTLVTVASALMKWSPWEGTPTNEMAPNFSLFTHVIDRLSVMAFGAMVTPDPACLDRPDEVTPHTLSQSSEDSGFKRSRPR